LWFWLDIFGYIEFMNVIFFVLVVVDKFMGRVLFFQDALTFLNGITHYML